ncbi:MAG: acyltransferase, partial [Lachnospiraceae bacterium]|nr:acyltransferase [Lachnospiraceae bacterium]
YLLWGGIYGIWRWHTGSMQMDFSTGIMSLYSIISMYINNRMEPIYWFFGPILSIYLSMPLLSICFENKKNQNALKYAIILGFITISFLPFSYNFFVSLLPNSSFGFWNSSWRLDILGGYLLFALLGYWASIHSFSKKEQLILYFSGGVCCLFRLFGMIYFFTLSGEKPEMFFDYLSFPSVIYALSIFVLFKSMNIREIKHKNIFSNLASSSFGIYLIHILVLTMMEKIVFFRNNPYIWHFVTPIICYFLCAAIVLLVKKFPVICHIFP